MRITPKMYYCEICGKGYFAREDCEKCEAQGIETPVLNVGDSIKFKDNEQTPIWWRETFKNPYDLPKYHEDYNICTLWKIVSNYSDSDEDFYVNKIELIGHHCEYLINVRNKPAEYWEARYNVAMVREDFGFGYVYYPIIKGNKQILQQMQNGYSKNILENFEV